MLRPVDKEQRDALGAQTGSRSVAPLDDYLGITGLPFKLSPRAMLEVAYWAQNQSSFERASTVLSEKMGMEVNNDTVRLVANYIGNKVFVEDCARADEAMRMLDKDELDFTRNNPGVLYIETDGAALNTRTKDENGSSWRENKLGEIFSSDNIRHWTDKKGNSQHRIMKKEYISYVGSSEQFKKHLFACALRNGYGKYSQTVILSDGAAWIRNIKEELFPEAQQILDYYHLCENVNEYAKHLFKMDEDKYKPWARDVCEALKAGEYERVLRGLDSTGCKTTCDCPVNLYGYIQNNVANIDYPTYIAKGYFIGSGSIESGNKLVLQQRLKQSGMRWNVECAQPILSLRAKYESNLWNSDVVPLVLSLTSAA